MKKMLALFVMAPLCFDAMAENTELDNALRLTYTSCIGIDDALHDMKVMAGINTAVTGVGTGLGIGAVAVGIAKANVDKTIEEEFEEMTTLTYEASGNHPVASKEKFLKAFKEYMNNDDLLSNLNENTQITVTVTTGANNSEQIARKNELTQKSKRLGNWRTGLIAGNTATNIAGAIIAGNNKVGQPLQEQIDNCKASVKSLGIAIAQAKINGDDVSEAQQIESACKEFEYIDVTKINNRAKGSMISSIVGTGTGVAGTITSAMANSNKIRDDDTDQGKQKEKNLNTAANVLSAGSAVASATATVFNASQIKAIKDVAQVAQKCTEVLK